MDAKKTKNLTINRYGFIVDPASPPMASLKFILVHFTRGRDTWKSYRVNPSELCFRYYNYLFVLSSLAYEQYYGMNQKANNLGLCKSAFPLHVNKTLNVTNPEHKYDRMANYYCDVERQESSDGRPKKYLKIPTELRQGFRSIFNIIRTTAGAKDARIELAQSIDSETVYFWQLEDFEPEILKDISAGQIKLPKKKIPRSSVKQVDITHLRNRICGDPLWQKWHKDKITDGNSITKSSTFKRLRGYLKEDALSGFKKQLHSDNLNEYISLKLRKRLNPMPMQISRIPDLGHTWNPIGLGELLFPGENYFLSSISGAGKTTFLRFFQNEILKEGNIPIFGTGKNSALKFIQIMSLKKNDFLPFYLRAKDIEGWDSFEKADIARYLSKHVRRTKSDYALRCCIDKAFEQGRIIFLIDAMDNLEIPGQNCSELVDQILVMTGDNPVIMTGRPSAIQYIEQNTNITLLRLEKIDSKACEKFLRPYYHKVLKLCKEDKNLLATPMFAYMAKKLVQEGNDQYIQSRWDLYLRYIKYVFSTHPPNRKTINHTQWRLDVQKAISIIAYHSIDRKKPKWENISSDILDELSESIPISIDLVSSSGIAEILQINEDPNLVFSHRSFQEYFAARWADTCPERTQHVLGGYWDPKWREIIKFLVGKNGQSVVEAIYPKACNDDVLHSRLFLAAECMAQMNVNSDIKARIVDDLSRLADSHFFRYEALIHLIRLGDALAHEAAWSIVCKTYEVAGAGINRINLTDLKPLYNKERLRWVLDRWLKQNLFSHLYIKLLASWYNKISPSIISKIIEKGVYDSLSHSYLFFYDLIAQLSQKQMYQLIQVLFSNKRDLYEDGRFMLASFVCQGVKLTASQISHLIETLDDPVGLPHLATILDHLSDELLEEHISKIINKWWNHKLCNTKSRYLLISGMPRVCGRLPASEIDDIIKALRHSDEDVGWHAANALTYCVGRLTNKQVQTILSYINREGMYSDNVHVVLQILPNIDKELANKILDNVSSQDQRIRISAMKSAYLLKKYINIKHIRQFEQNFKNATNRMLDLKSLATRDKHLCERHAAMFAITSVIDRISDDTIQYILDTLDSYDFSATLPREIFTNLSERMDRSQAAVFIKRLNRETNIYCVESLCLLLKPEKITKEGIQQLCQIFKYKDIGDSCFHVLKLLRRLHAFNGMKGI